MLSHPQRALSACTTGGILQNPSLILRCFYKGRGRGGIPLFVPVPSGNRIPEDGDSRLGQKPGWNRNSESKALSHASVCHPFRFPRELFTFHVLGLQSLCDSTCEVLTQPIQPKLFPHFFPPVVPAQASCQYTPITFLPPHHHQSLSSPTDFSYASHLCLLLSAENCPPASNVIRNVLKTLFCFWVQWFGIWYTLKQRFSNFGVLTTS